MLSLQITLYFYFVDYPFKLNQFPIEALIFVDSLSWFILGEGPGAVLIASSELKASFRGVLFASLVHEFCLFAIIHLYSIL